MVAAIEACPAAPRKEELILLVGVEGGSWSHRMRLKSGVGLHQVKGGRGRGHKHQVRCLLREAYSPPQPCFTARPRLCVATADWAKKDS